MEISVGTSDALCIRLDHVSLVAMLNDLIEIFTHMLLELALGISMNKIDAVDVRGLMLGNVAAVAVSGVREVYKIERTRMKM
jgi:hypothetical protein